MTALPLPTVAEPADALRDTLPDAGRRGWIIATGVAGGAAALATAVPLVSSMSPSERARAAGAAVEVDIGDIPPGGMKTVEWRGKPVWIVRRTPEQLAALPALDPQLVDPASRRDQQPAAAANAHRPDAKLPTGGYGIIRLSPEPVVIHWSLRPPVAP